MNAGQLLDPAYRDLVDQAPSALTAANLAQRRLAARQAGLQMAARRDDGTVRMSWHRIPGPAGAGEVRVLIYTPASQRERYPALLHMHGGGMVLGCPENADARNRRLVREVGCVVISVEYRLAPETPFPGGLEDCYAALRWVHAHAGALRVDRDRIAVGGESAGAGLAAALALMVRDRKEFTLVFQMLTYPMLDDRTGSSVLAQPHAGQFVWTPVSNRFGWASLLGKPPGGEGVSAYAAPARARDLYGLPPAFIAVGALDLFIDENLEYARRLICAGVPTRLHVYPGAPHGFDEVAQAESSRHYWDAMVRALRAALHPAADA